MTRPIRRITRPTLEVVRTLGEHGPLHGFEIARRANRPAGTAYNVLERLLENGYARSWWEKANPVEGRPPRRFYELTDEGRLWAAEVLAQRAASGSWLLGLRPQKSISGED